MDEAKVTSGSMKAHDNLRFPSKIFLKETDRIQKWVEATLVDRHSDGTYHHATVKLSKLKRNSKNDTWPSQPEIYALEEQEVEALYDYLGGLQKLQSVPANSDYVFISGNQGVKQLGSDAGKALIGLLMDAVNSGNLDGLLRLANLDSSSLSGRTSKNAFFGVLKATMAHRTGFLPKFRDNASHFIVDKSFLRQTASTLENIGAAVRHTRYKQELKELIDLVERNAVEQEIQTWIKRNHWIFGTEYTETLTTRQISLHCKVDILFASVDGFSDVIELKRAEPSVFVLDTSHNCYSPSASLSEVLGQVINYLQKIEDYRLQIQNDDSIVMLKPRGRIVIGRSKDWNTGQKQALRRLNASLTNIDVMTYDQLIKRGKILIKMYSDTSKNNPINQPSPDTSSTTG